MTVPWGICPMEIIFATTIVQFSYIFFKEVFLC